jgi:hypothetical protein
MDRRSFLGALPAGAGLALIGQQVAHIPKDGEKKPSPVHDLYPTQDPVMVKEIVTVAHTDLDRVKELVEAKPELAKAAWDWGFGDWESALGAASHMGRRDIADVLIDHGARPNLFSHAMMGDLDVVKAAIEAHPGVQAIPGPHGISLLTHAKFGGEDASAVATYLAERGDADPKATSLETDEEQLKVYVGKYRFADGNNDYFEVLLNRRGMLSIKRGDAPFGRVLLRVEEHGFAPGGAPSVRVRFRFQRGSVLGLSIHDPEPTVGARKLA